MLKGTNHDRTNYTHFSLLFARCSTAGARRAACWGGSGGAVKTGMRSQTGGGGAGAGGPPGGGGGRPPHLPAICRDRRRGRRGPEGVVHGAAAASQVRPSVGGRGGGCWIREAGHCGRERREQSRGFQKHTCGSGQPAHPGPFSLPPRLDTCPLSGRRGSKGRQQGGGQGPIPEWAS